MSCDQITCATSSEIKWSPVHHKEKPEDFLPGVELLQANTERGLCCPSAQREQLHILMEQKSFQGRGITCQQYAYYHPFTQLRSPKDKPKSLRTSPLTVFQARDPRELLYLQGYLFTSIFTRFLQSRCPYNVPTIQISQATSLHSPLWVTGTKIWNVSIGKPQDTQPPSPQYFQAVLTSSHQCGGNTAPLWWGYISQHGNPKQVLHPSRTACPDPAAFFQLPGSFMTLAWYKLLIQGLKQRDNQTPRKR